MPSGVPPTPSSRSMPVPSRAAMIAPATSPSVISLIRAPAARTSLDQLGMPGPVQDHHGDVLRRAALGPGHGGDVVRGRCLDVHHVRRGRAGHQLGHVEHRGRVVHRPAGADRDHGDRVRHAVGGQAGAVDRVHRDVAQRPAAVADLLAVVEHGRVVLLALADDHHAVHRHGVDEGPHRVHRGPVRAVLVAPADPAGGRHRPRLGDPGQFEREVTVRRLPPGLWLRGQVPRGRRPGAPASSCVLLGHRRDRLPCVAVFPAWPCQNPAHLAGGRSLVAEGGMPWAPDVGSAA